MQAKDEEDIIVMEYNITRDILYSNETLVQNVYILLRCHDLQVYKRDLFTNYQVCKMLIVS